MFLLEFSNVFFSSRISPLIYNPLYIVDIKFNNP